MSVFVRPPQKAAIVEAKAGPIGTGAGPLLTEYPLLSILGGRDPRSKMRKAYQLGVSVPWIRAAERVISETILRQEWHLEDAEDCEIDDEYPNAEAKTVLALLERPTAALKLGQQLTRSNLWKLTLRHTGLCGNAFWFLDQLDPYGTPAAIVYIRPDRMTPVEDANGNLTAWALDRTANDPGVTVRLEQVLHFVYDPPDEGHYGIGLVESALMKAQLSTALDQHLAQVLAAGGRLTGIISPKTGDHLEQPQFDALVQDLRSVVEQPNPAQRLQIVKGPIEFNQTAMNLLEMAVRDFMTGARDDLLGLWGVPLSQLGVHDRGRGLQGGTVVLGDEAVLWQNACAGRVEQFTETIQYQLLDRWQEKGLELEFEIEQPEFDDEAPKYDLLVKSLNTPLTNKARLAIIGQEPFGPDVIGQSGGPLDDEVWLPATMTYAFSANPDAKPETTAPAPAPTPVAPETTAVRMAGETTDGMMPMPMKAGNRARSVGRSIQTLRKTVGERVTPRIASAVRTVLDEQRREVAARLRGNPEHIASQPSDVKAWWDRNRWDRRMREAMQPHLIGMAETLDAHVRSVLEKPAKAGPVGAVETVLSKGAARITAINERTREAIQAWIAQGIEDGLSMTELADGLEAGTAQVSLVGGGVAFDEYRAEMIARTETGMAYNEAAYGSYRDAGIGMVEVLDGDGDDICAQWAGWVGPIDEGPEPLGHPNCTRDILPFIE